MIQPAKVVVLYPKAIIIATVAVTVAYLAIILIRGVEFNGSPETLARHDETFEFYNQTRNVFGDDKVIIVGITTRDVFDRSFLERLDRLTNRLSAVSGVDKVLSLANINAIKRESTGISITRLIDLRRIDSTDSTLAALKSEVTNDPLYARHYVSQDGTTAAIDIFLKPISEGETRQVAEEVERVARSE